MINFNRPLAQRTPAAPVNSQATEQPKAETQNTERLTFVNDLTPERKEELVRIYAENIRQELEKDRLSINFVVRLVNRQFRQVAALAKENDSATSAIDTLSGKTEQLVKRSSRSYRLR